MAKTAGSPPHSKPNHDAPTGPENLDAQLCSQSRSFPRTPATSAPTSSTPLEIEVLPPMSSAPPLASVFHRPHNTTGSTPKSRRSHQIHATLAPSPSPGTIRQPDSDPTIARIADTNPPSPPPNQRLAPKSPPARSFPRRYLHKAVPNTRSPGYANSIPSPIEPNLCSVSHCHKIAPHFASHFTIL